ncbi:glycosyltransferase [Blastococcus sp. Marseille-P5729]|uniref:glycosyltransferase n=1 Tax=Blastococcus sp. Marseille-P5729 TaxID=2086582 RepID=UPI00351A4502
MNRPIRITHVLGILETGGTELRMRDLVGCLAAKGLEADFVTLSGKEGSLADSFRAIGATVSPLRAGPLFPLKLFLHLRATRPHAIQSHVATFSGLILSVARLAGVRVRIAHFHSDGDGRPSSIRRRLYRAVMRQLIYWNATNIVGVSPSALSEGYSKHLSQDNRALVIPNGFVPSRSRYEPLPEVSARIFLSLGRASSEKNLSRMPAVLAAYRDRHGPATLRIVGPRDIQIDCAVLERATHLDVKGYVAFSGPTSDIGDELAGASALLLTSVREGLPSVVIEAAAIGLPVVSSDIAGSRWIASWFPWVHCVSLAADDQEWADALEKALSARPPLEVALRTFQASPFSMDQFAQSFTRLYTIDSTGHFG